MAGSPRLRTVRRDLWQPDLRQMIHVRRSAGLPYDRLAMATGSNRSEGGVDGERVPISTSDQKILFARSGNVCAFPGCSRQLVEPATAKDDAAVTLSAIST